MEEGRIPTLAEYLAMQADGGGMLLAAQWGELAHRAPAAQWSAPVVQRMLDAYSTVGCLTDDLATDATRFGAVQAIATAEHLEEGASVRSAGRHQHGLAYSLLLVDLLVEVLHPEVVPVPGHGGVEVGNRHADVVDRHDEVGGEQGLAGWGSGHGDHGSR